MIFLISKNKYIHLNKINSKKINNSRMNMESRYLSDIMSDLFNQAIIFAQQYFKVLNTNLLIYSSEISQFLAGFVNNLNEKM